MRNMIKVAAAILLVMAAAFFAAAYKEHKPYREAEKSHTQLKDLVLYVEKEENAQGRKIDFSLLQRINPEIAAWLYIPGTSIDYPVLIGETDTYYLKRDYKRSKSSLGAIFAFSDTSREMTDAHICLFGHNMKESQMFGELKKYMESEFAKKHEKLYLYMPERTEVYRLCAAFSCEKTDAIFRHKMKAGSKEMEALTKRIAEKSKITTPETGKFCKAEKILTLSSCSDYERTRMRTTVHFEKIVE